MINKIGVFDSGIGGLNILKRLEESIPNENYIYYQDSYHNPYGEKTEEELYSIVKDIVKYLISENCKIIVIACNTATTICMEKLREDFPSTIFIGTVPAIKMAIDNNCKNTLVMATPLTIKSKRTHEIINDYKKEDTKITLLPCSGLAHAIETNTKVDDILKEILLPYQEQDFDSLVLGCTHYSYIEDKIKSYFKKNIHIYDSIDGVIKEVKNQLVINNLENKSKKEKTIYLNR